MLKFPARKPDPLGVEPTSVAPAPAPPNGGFPEPWTGAPVQLIRATHEGCGGTTLVRLPPELPTRAVRVVVCGTCQESFEVDQVEELGALAPSPKRRERPTRAPKAKAKRAPRKPSGGRSVLEGRWALLAVPAALAAVIGALLLIQGGDSSSTTTPTVVQTQKPAAPPGVTAPSPNATLIRGSSYTLALPAGWVRTQPANGATFSAHAADGSGDATLWVQRDPKLNYHTFVQRSLARLRLLAGTAHVVDRVPAPTAEGTIVRLEANAPPGKPAYDVTLRVAGAYRYYLATTLQPSASAQALKGVTLVNNSLTPTVIGGSTP
jgi:hypothetical protein